MFLFFFLSLQLFSCNNVESYTAILKDIRSSELFINFVEEKDICSNLKVMGYLYNFHTHGDLFIFDYADISEYMYKDFFGENKKNENIKFKVLEKLSSEGKACFRVAISETFNNKIVIELIPENTRINEHLIYLYEVLPDKSIKKLEEFVLIVE